MHKARSLLNALSLCAPPPPRIYVRGEFNGCKSFPLDPNVCLNTRATADMLLSLQVPGEMEIWRVGSRRSRRGEN